jgi:DNA repair protein RadC
VKAIILVRNQISGDPVAATEDIQVARHLMKAGELLRIEVLDYVIAGRQGHASLRSLGHFGT